VIDGVSVGVAGRPGRRDEFRALERVPDSYDDGSLHPRTPLGLDWDHANLVVTCFRDCLQIAVLAVFATSAKMSRSIL
jgi:hypothetical protein